MPRRDDDKVVPFRPRRDAPRKWTRPEDFGHDPRRAARTAIPPPGKATGRPRATGWRLVAAWLAIIAIVAATIYFSR